MQLNGTAAAIQDYLAENLDAYLEMLHQMVAINSYTANPDGINDLATVTAALFARLGFRAEAHRAANYPAYGDHLVLERRGSGPHKIGLVSHLDTVFSREEEIANEFWWRPEGDRLYGPGTVDIKGGTLGIYMLLDAIREFAPQQFEATTWVILFNSAEERGADDFQHLVTDKLAGGGVACLVFEGGLVQDEQFLILVQRKGMATFRVTVEGRATHAGTHHAHGANAIVQLADLCRQIADFTDYEQEITFNVGYIEGGSVTNRVPHYAMAQIEMRAYEPAVYQAGLQKMLNLTQQISVRSPLDGYGCKVRVEVEQTAPPWPRNPGTDRLFEIWQQAGSALGYRVLPQARGGLSDGNYFWDKIPTIDALGPSGANAHCSERTADGSKDQEYAVRSSFVPKTLLNAIAVLRLLEDS